MKKIYAYAHTHWDREWYQPFETYRVYLVAVLRQILDDLEAGKLTRFYLDGQTVILEDALAIAPELGERVSALMQKGSLSAGPWYVMPDEMLVCGESLVRNLKLGIAGVRKYGTPELVGYSPDTFGHTQDLPRILCGFGINSAFLWRGVPPLSSGPCFWWKSPDGSQVLAYHLSRGYYQTSLIEKTRDGFSPAAIAEVSDELYNFAEDRRQWENASLYDKTPDALLYPIGADHTAPPRNLSEDLQSLNKSLKIKGLEIELVHLHEFVKTLETQANATQILVGMVAKELRDNSASAQYGNAYLLPGVLSTRLYLKRENREAERRLFRFVEPLFSLLALRRIADYPHAELNHALRLLLKNHPHDSICGCSVDAVHEEMMTRFARIHQVLNPLLESAAMQLSSFPEEAALSPDDPAASLRRLRAINPHGRKFSGVVAKQWFVPVGEAETHGNARSQSHSQVHAEDHAQTTVHTHATHIHAAHAHAKDTVQIVETELVDQLFSGFGRVPYYSLLERKKGWIWLENIVPFGEDNLAWPLEAQESKVPLAKMHGKTMDNGILTVNVDEKSQISVSWKIGEHNKRHFDLTHVLSDLGDAGDTYNFDPVPGDKPIIAKLVGVQPKLKGPLVCSLLLKYEIAIPETIVEDKMSAAGRIASKLPSFRRSGNRIKHEIETEIILKRGSRILEFETTWVNKSSGHRLEVQMSTGLPVHASFSENHFSLVRRYHQTKSIHKLKLPVEVGCEAPCDRFPTQRFVVSNGQLFLNKGLPEYGADGDAVSITLLRAVAQLSRGRMQTRGGGAGPHLPVPGADRIGLNSVSYAWAPLELLQKRRILSDVLEDSTVCEAFDLAESYEQEIFTALTSRSDTATHSLLQCDNPYVRILGAYVSDDHDSVFVRLQNICTEALGSRVLVDFDFQSAHLCRLDEETGEEVFLLREYLKVDTEGGAETEREICALDINFSANEVKTIEFRLNRIATEKPASVARTRKKRSSSSKTG